MTVSPTPSTREALPPDRHRQLWQRVLQCLPRSWYSGAGGSLPPGPHPDAQRNGPSATAKALGAAAALLVLATIGTAAEHYPRALPQLPERLQGEWLAPSPMTVGSTIGPGGSKAAGTHVPAVSSEQANAPTEATPPASRAPPDAPSPAVLADGRVVLNSATLTDLQRLPKVGPKRAEAILKLRTQLGGRFRRLSDLLRVRGIGPSTLKRLTPLVVLDAPKG